MGRTLVDELEALAAELDVNAHLWRRHGLLALADRLGDVAEAAREEVSAILGETPDSAGFARNAQNEQQTGCASGSPKAA